MEEMLTINNAKVGAKVKMGTMFNGEIVNFLEKDSIVFIQWERHHNTHPYRLTVGVKRKIFLTD